MIANETIPLIETTTKTQGSPFLVFQWPDRIARICGAAVVLLGLTVLLGWMLDLHFLKGVLPGLVQMKANTALCFLLSGAALWVAAYPGSKYRRSLPVVSSFLIASFSLATAVQYLGVPNLGIDEVFFRDFHAAGLWGQPAGRMAFVSAVAFVMVSCSLVLLQGRASTVSQLLACAVALIALFSLAGYLCQEVAITGISPFTSLAVHTAGGLTILSIGLLAAAPPRGPVAVLVSASRSGALARLLLPAALGVTLGLGALGAAGQRAGLYEPVYGIALFALTSATILGTVIWYVAHRALLSENSAGVSENRVRLLNEVLERRVVERTAALEAVTANLRLEIEERRSAEDALFQTRAQLMDAIDSLDAGFAMYGPDDKMVVCNTNYKEISNLMADLLVPGTPYETIVRHYFRTGAIANRGLSEEEWVAERLHAHRNPGPTHERWLSDRWVRVSDRRTSNGSVVSLRTDITALKRAQEAAEAANRAKSEFLANMSHEIRTPMNGILGMTELTLDTDLTGEQRKNLGMVKTSADSLLQLINDILDFSKIEAGMLDLDPTLFALRDSLGATVKALGQRAYSKGLELICHIDAPVPDDVVGDALRLRQIVTNLVGNAIKFTERGEVVIRVVVEDETAATVFLHFTVRDTGIGIPADKQKMIFEPFSQADASTTRSFGGTGLGLTIILQLVSLMDGRVWVESELGTGSTFHFTAHLAKHTGPIPKPVIESANLESLPVLIVDDNSTNRAMLEELLTNWRMRPSTVSDGPTAIAALKNSVAEGEPFSLVLLDVCMPEIDGFSVAEQIRSDPELANIAIIIFSSADRKGDAARCRELGIACYLLKPIIQSELFDSISTALGGTPSKERKSHCNAKVEAVPGQRPLRILLAEDNEINRELAVTLLRKRGHTVVLAVDGREALAAWEREPIDLILMDIQMPVMDGFAATAAIRDIEKTKGGHIPIMALTAHAMKGDLERCLSAGMDAYITKPLRVKELFEGISRLIPSASGSKADLAIIQEPIPAGEEKPVEDAFDQVWALSHVDGDGPLLRKMIGLFHTQAEKLLPEIRSAGLRGDGETLERCAHKLRGSMGCFAARRASEAAHRLEAMGHDGEFTYADEASLDLEMEVAHLRKALMTYTEEGATA